MKTSRTFALVVTALVVGFLAARWCAAQPAPSRAADKESATDNYIGLRQLEAFVGYPNDTKQTNTMKRFNEYMNTTIVSGKAADLGINVAILQRLRDGRTNDAFNLLEGRVNSDVTMFVSAYRELPASLQEKVSLKPVEIARDYRAKHPFKHRYPIVDEGVEKSFKLLDEKSAK